MYRPTWLAALILFGLGLLASPASAEWFADLYVGAAFTQKDDVSVSIPDAGLRVTEQSDPGTSVSVGGRVGYWFDGIRWLGLALDASYFRPGEDLDVYPISPLVMVRWPLQQSTEFPAGRIQPYIAIGPGIFVSKTEFTVEEIGERLEDTSVDLGLDVRGGLTWLLARNVGLFGEYRFTHFEAEHEGTLLGLKTTLEATLPTHHIVVGVTFRF